MAPKNSAPVLDCGGLAAALPAPRLRAPSQSRPANRSFPVARAACPETCPRVRQPPIFPTAVHTFAQTFPLNSIDAAKHNEYLPLQIEPKSLKTLRLSFESAAA